MNLGKRLFGLLLVTCLLLLVAWFGLKLMQNGGSWEKLWQDAQDDLLRRFHGPVEFFQRQLQPRLQELALKAQELLQNAREFTGQAPDPTAQPFSWTLQKP